MLHIVMGPNLFKTKMVKCNNGNCVWYELLPEKICLFPSDVEDIPDLIVYFCD